MGVRDDFKAEWDRRASENQLMPLGLKAASEDLLLSSAPFTDRSAEAQRKPMTRLRYILGCLICGLEPRI